MAKTQIQLPNAVSAAVLGGGVGSVATAHTWTSLFVADLDINITDAQLFDLFNSVGSVVSVRICRDINSRGSLGYGYVNFHNSQDAASAIEALNFTPLNNKTIRIMYSQRDPSFRKSGTANIFIKNLDKSIDNRALHETFTSFGNILSCKIATDPNGQSKGYGFVQFDSEAAAQNAIDKLNGMLMNDKQVYVGHFVRKQERDTKIKFTNVYVKNLVESAKEEDLKNVFGEFGTITSAIVMRSAEGKSRCFGFVNFENADDAAKSVEALNGKTFDDKEWYVGKAQKKSEREQQLKNRFEQYNREAANKFQGLNLYIKNLNDSIDDEKLKALFSEFGTITSCKVNREANGYSKGSGFVAFSTQEEASKALIAMNGKMVMSKPLYVAIAERKEERRARLQAQFSQVRLMAMQPSMGPRMPLFYGQAHPAVIPPQAGFGYQQQLVPGMRPVGSPMQNFFVPMVRPGQHGQASRWYSKRGGSQLPFPLMQQQMFPRGHMYRYPPGRNVPCDTGLVRNSPVIVPQKMPITALTSALTHATAERQRVMLGENLYPLVDELEHENAGKVTGMLLEMDQTEVLHLLESPEALKKKVEEAMDVLRNGVEQQPNGPAAEQLSIKE